MRKHEYRYLSPEQLEEVFSNFLIDSWSYSKVSTFARNEKAFEMSYVYGERNKFSATSVAGNAYHEALRMFFESIKQGKNIDVVDMELLAFNYVEEIPANKWKIQKTTPTVEDCKIKAIKTTAQLINNFFQEKSTYLEEVESILEVENYYDEFLTINGVDIPLPCHGVLDLVIKTIGGKTVIIDHKSKMSFTNDADVALTISKQAMTYVLLYEAKHETKVDEVWFVENKYSQNRDKSAQLNKFIVEINEDVRKLYEALLYEPLRRMIQAVSDPDYIYLINEQDNFVDLAEIFDFWAKTQIAEIEDFNIPEAKKELIEKRLKKVKDSSLTTLSPSVIKKFKTKAADFIQYDLSGKDMKNEEKIEHVLRTFGIIARVAHVFNGYSSNTYLLEVSSGVKLKQVYSHRMDIANALDVSGVRMMDNLKVYDGKSYVSIETSKKRDRDLNFDPKELSSFKIPIGKNNYEELIYWDLDNHSTPHVLICGATGSGKSVSIKSTIEYLRLAKVDKIIVLDPKYEFLEYNRSKDIEVYNEIEDIENIMALMVMHMNDLVKEGKKERIAIIFDEFADAVSMARSGKELDKYEDVQEGFFKQSKAELEMGFPPQPKMKRKKVGTEKSLEENLKILLQKGRSSGFRIVAATQRASVKVITGDAKVNFPVQICFRVPKDVDSKVVLDEAGAESLAGAGDGLIKSPEFQDMQRFQAFYKK